MTPGELGAQSFCYVTTVGRVTGRPHTIEIWFALHGSTLYLLSGAGWRSDTVRNIEADPAVTVRIGDRTFEARGRVVEDDDEDRRARDLVFAKYASTYGGDLRRWRESAMPVAIDLEAN